MKAIPTEKTMLTEAKEIKLYNKNEVFTAKIDMFLVSYIVSDWCGWQ